MFQAHVNQKLISMRHENPLMWISKFWVEFESLLVEAVQRNSRAGLVHLLDYEERMQSSELISKEDGEFGREKDSSHALILAARNGNYQLMKIFLDKQYTIAPPHLIDCSCLRCLDNKLGQSKKRMEALQALSDPIWISLTSEDPFLTAFKLCKQSRTFSIQDDCFENNYRKLAESNQQFCLDLLDEIESEKEGCCLMAHKKICEYVRKEDHLHCDDVTFVQLAIEYNQKEVVAHPISQHFITSIVFDNIPRWRTSSLKYKILFILFAAFLYPITTVCNIFFPCSSAGRIARQPLVKFINVASSFITFLCLLAWMASSKRGSSERGLMNGKVPSNLEVIVFVWLIGLCVGEIQQLVDNGIRDYFSSGWNFIDINMMALMVISFITWTVLFLSKVDKKDGYYKDIYNLVDGLFALAIILSFFRLVYLMQITRYLGLLQLCLGEMIQVIFQFAFISVVVLCSFSVAMAFLCQSSESYRQYIANKHNETRNATKIYWLLNVSYDGLPPTMITLIWGALNMVTIKSLDGLDDGSFIHLWSHLLFGLYYCVSMIVLLNMLIAMMSNSYQRIENNLEVEHKFSRTVLWVDYIGDENARPVPFNLIPSLKTIKMLSRRLCGGTKQLFKRHNSRMQRERKPELNKAAHDKYKSLCSVLVERYLIKKHGFNYKEESQEKGPENAQFVRKVKLQCVMWTSKYQRYATFSSSNSNNNTCDVDTNTSHSDQLYTAVEGQWDSMERNMLCTSDDKDEPAELTSNC